MQTATYHHDTSLDTSSNYSAPPLLLSLPWADSQPPPPPRQTSGLPARSGPTSRPSRPKTPPPPHRSPPRAARGQQRRRQKREKTGLRTHGSAVPASAAVLGGSDGGGGGSAASGLARETQVLPALRGLGGRASQSLLRERPALANQRAPSRKRNGGGFRGGRRRTRPGRE